MSTLALYSKQETWMGNSLRSCGGYQSFISIIIIFCSGSLHFPASVASTAGTGSADELEGK